MIFALRFFEELFVRVLNLAALAKELPQSLGFTMRVLLLSAACRLAAEDRYPGETLITSPRGSFRITPDMHNDSWQPRLHFLSPGGESIILADDSPWLGRFFVSPDDQWLLQIQKAGSGDNISFLYRIEENARIWRTEEQLGALAFRFLDRTAGLEVEHLYHTGIEFVSWDMSAGLLRFSIHGSSGVKGTEGVEQEMVYDVKKHAFRTPKT